MARDILYETYSGSRGELIPVKWTAPEVNYISLESQIL